MACSKLEARGHLLHKTGTPPKHFSRECRSVLVNLKRISYFYGIYTALTANIWEIATFILARNLNSGLNCLFTTAQVLKSIFLSKVASRPKNFILAPSNSDNLIDPSWSSIQMDLYFGVQPKRFVSTDIYIMTFGNWISNFF